MPDEEQPPIQPRLDLDSTPAEPELPPVIPPKTRTPYHVNTQVNIQQIPPKVWDKLSAEQIVDLSKLILDQIERADQRQYEAALARIKATSAVNQRAMIVGGILMLAGLAAIAFLAKNGNSIVAGFIGLFLATMLAVVVGNRYLRD